jgi:GT2 family glycosyltransferase
MLQRDNKKEREFLEPGVTIVIVTFRRPLLLDSLVSQLNSQTEKPSKIIIVDNDLNESAKNIVENCNSESDRIPVLYMSNKFNSLTTGRNLGVSKVQTEYTCLLDDDVVLSIDYLKRMKMLFQTTQGALGMQGMLEIAPRSSLRNLLSYLSGNFYLSKHYSKVRWSISASYPGYYHGKSLINCQWLSGSNQFYRTTCLRNISWDEKLIAYCDGEDLDHSFRVYKSNPGSLYLIPDLKVKHLETSESRVLGFKNQLMREAYSFYLLHKLFPGKKIAKISYIWSRTSTLWIEFLRIPMSGFQKSKLKIFTSHCRALLIVFRLRRGLKLGSTLQINDYFLE